MKLFSRKKQAAAAPYTPRAERCAKENQRLKTRAIQRINRLKLARQTREKRGASPESLAQLDGSIAQYEKQLRFCEEFLN